MAINSESTLSEYLIRMNISIPANGSPQTLRQLLNQNDSFFNKRPKLLNHITTVKIQAQGDFSAGTINEAGNDFEPETTQTNYLTTDPAPYQEPIVGTAALDIEAFEAVGGAAVSAVAFCYMSKKENSAIDHSTVEVP